MKRRCFVVSGQAWARFFGLVEQDDLGTAIWSRLEVISGPAPRRAASKPGRAPRRAEITPGPSDDGRQFAGDIMRAAGAAMRRTGADELILVAPPMMLASLNVYRSVLMRHGIAVSTVPMSLELLARHTRQLLDGAVTRSFSFASATPALTRAA